MISVVVSVYNSASTVELLVQRIASVLDGGESYELLLVNDGSTDASWQRISQVAEQHDHIHALDLMRNYGQHNALLAGIRAARGDVVVTIDDDLQNPPEEVPKLLAKLNEGFDVVYGTPIARQHGLPRAAATGMAKLALRSVIGEIAEKVSSFRAFRTDLREVFEHVQGPYVSIDALLSWSTTSYAAVPVAHAARAAGQSHYGFRKLATHAINVLTGFSTMPLRIASLIGIAFTLLGAVVLVYVLVRYFIEGDVVPGFPFLASIITIFSGAQLLALGIIGEYLARMHVRLMDRPPYVVREEVVSRERATTG